MPFCTEKKLLLSGGVQIYSCELVRYEPGFGMLKFIVDREYDIKGIKLLPGDVTCALYWEDRPYTLYVWNLKRHEGPLYYFNIADRISLRLEQFTWRDLVVDILIDPRGAAHVLDEGELPVDLDSNLAVYIQKAKELVLAHFREIIRETRELLHDRSLC
jgi:hypothetical protein